jgi:hypothetical protein
MLSLALAVVACGCQPPASKPVGSSAGQSSLAPPPPGVAASDGLAAEEEAALIAAYRAAHASQDVDAMLKMYWLGGVSDDMRQVVRENIEAEMRHPIKAIRFGPPPDQPAVREEGGIRWRNSLPTVAILTVDYDVARAAPGEWATQQAELAVGRKGGKLYFTAPVQE